MLKKIIRTLKKRFPLFLFLIFYILLSLFTYKAYGITNDEPEEYALGKLLYIKLIADDPVLEKSFVINDGKSNLYDYDRIYQAGLYALNSSESYEIYHLLNLLTACLIFIAAYEMCYKFAKNNKLALIGPILILLTPRFFGHIAANPKDVPFAIVYFISLASIVLLKKHDQPLSILLLGISFGFTQSLRLVGYSIYVIYLIFALLEKNNFANFKKIFSIILRFSLIFCVGFLIHLLSHPFLGADPLGNFMSLINSSKNYPWSGKILYNSQLITTQELPWHYLPTWILITTPISIIFLMGYNLKFYKKHQPAEKLLWLAFNVNLILFFVLKPKIYDGLRHMLHLLPLISTLAAFSLIRLIKQKKKIVTTVMLTHLFFIIICIIRLFPYQYTYFNELILGTRGAEGKYELDYWGASYKETVTWLNKNTDQDQKQTVYICGDTAQFTHYASEHLKPAKNIDEAEIIICHTRADNEEKLEQFHEILHQVKRNDVVLNKVKKNDGKNF